MTFWWIVTPGLLCITMCSLCPILSAMNIVQCDSPRSGWNSPAVYYFMSPTSDTNRMSRPEETKVVIEICARSTRIKMMANGRKPGPKNLDLEQSYVTGIRVSGGVARCDVSELEKGQACCCDASVCQLLRLSCGWYYSLTGNWKAQSATFIKFSWDVFLWVMCERLACIINNLLVGTLA